MAPHLVPQCGGGRTCSAARRCARPSPPGGREHIMTDDGGGTGVSTCGAPCQQGACPEGASCGGACHGVRRGREASWAGGLLPRPGSPSASKIGRAHV